MKTIFLEARHNKNFTLPANVITKLKKYKTLALFTTVQFLDSIPKIKKQLEKANIKVQLIQTKHCQYKAQLLGCSILESKIKAGVDVFLYLGDGLFHPIALKISNNKSVLAFNPFTKKVSEITDQQTKKMQQQQKAALVKFHTSKEIGVLITTKSGQHNMKAAKKLEKKFPNKKYYFFIFDTLDFTQLENFPFIDCYVNTACPRISYDDQEKSPKKIIDISLLQ
ncbi:hypothetical protein HN695_04020 [Candidatus Woesearchaeota archaeon]|nr:hypothetical protein [Candidatus Woesearchaeota archaeon]MBT5272315.1 hypothetical protein [Candidatus Woesearchaeota archaeon]MBT6040644.1 hypothetical protein [Candidatus Woesearchaeota archaeon]MBT6336587.1 hypothetical protein [Candidatus Woesearchaeota archaeon]MBT7927477.1 hypothetical protein [Candidatus Woesearchaeota archaeon]